MTSTNRPTSSGCLPVGWTQRLSTAKRAARRARIMKIISNKHGFTLVYPRVPLENYPVNKTGKHTKRSITEKLQ